MIRVPYTDFPQQYQNERLKLLHAIQEVLEEGDFILGRAVETFEDRFAELCSVPFAVGVGSGTDALMVALKALGVETGHEVITVPNSWISTVSSIALTGATPVFVDVGQDMNIDPERIEQAITPKTKAILPVHLTGRPAKMDHILEIANRYDLCVIEDAAQAVGAKYRNKPTGAMGHAGCFSLHPLKNLNACGDAGVITCQDEKLAERLRMMRNHGLENRNQAKFWGLCSRLDALQAAILNVRLDNLKEVEYKRLEIAAYYNEHLKDYVNTPEPAEGEYNVYHTYIIQTKKRDALEAYLKEKNISVKIHYPIPVHLQEAAEYLGYKQGDFPNAEQQCKEILTLPVHQYLTREQQAHVVRSIAEFFESRAQKWTHHFRLARKKLSPLLPDRKSETTASIETAA